MKNFVRVAAITPKLTLARPDLNADAIIACVREAAAEGANIIVTPELALTGATCGDLFYHPTLHEQVTEALHKICEATKTLEVLCVIGAPQELRGKLTSGAWLIAKGTCTTPPVCRLLGDKRFASGLAAGQTEEAYRDATAYLWGDVLLQVVVGQDIETRISTQAHLVLHLGAEPETVTCAAYRRDNIKQLSAQNACAVASAWAGMGESSAEGVYSGHRLGAVAGRVITEARWSGGISYLDFNFKWLDFVRQRDAAYRARTVSDCFYRLGNPCAFDADGRYAGLMAHPFLPEDEAELAERCEEILRIQSHGLARRFTHIHAKRLVIGLSGGLDSTIALVVCAEMCKLLNLSPSTILGVTMPGFGTGSRTRSNVDKLAEAYGIELREINIGAAVAQHFADIGHDPAVLDVTYENAQARERTQILMDLANQENALLVGTGDLSEIALGWSTYNGDHMSMYNVNAGLPKTLIAPLLTHIAASSDELLRDALEDICATPVSPELLPGGKQETEKLVGRYEIHDLFLYYFIKYGADRETLRELGKRLLGLSEEQLDHTLDIFCKRFVQQQFKRSCAPDAPRLGSIHLSTAAWDMPADTAMCF